MAIHFIQEKKVNQDCVFCDRTQFEERLIAEDESFYVIATLGQITDGGYIILVPKEHVSCFGASPAGLLTGFVPLIANALREEYTSRTITIFEHGIVGQTIKHAHLHLLPANLNLTERVRNDFSIAEIDAIGDLGNMELAWIRSPKQPYLLWGNSANDMRVCWDPPAPLQYFRKVAAELLGRPERANWRTMDPELDRTLWSETVTRLKRYF